MQVRILPPALNKYTMNYYGHNFENETDLAFGIQTTCTKCGCKKVEGNEGLIQYSRSGVITTNLETMKCTK